MMIGIQQGSEVDLIALFASRRFGLKHYGSIHGRVATFGAVRAALGLVTFGCIHDATGTYDWALIGMAFTTGAAFAGLGRVWWWACRSRHGVFEQILQKGVSNSN